MPAQPASLASLLDELYQKQCVLGGWIAVLSLSEASVQRLMAGQWPASAQLSVDLAEPGESPAPLVLTLGSATFGLDDKAEAITFSQAVTAAALQRGSSAADASAITLSDGAAIEGTVALQVRAEANEPTTSVALDLANATVSLRGLELASVPSDLGARIANALAADCPYPPLASLDLSPDPASAPSALQPASLQHRVSVTPSGSRVLQLLIAGPDGAPAGASIDVTEPVPTADGCDYSLLVESGVVIQDIVTGFNAQTGLVKLVAVNPDPTSGSGSAAYAQTRNPMQFQGKITCGNAITPILSSAAMGMNFKGSTTDGLVVSGYALPGGTISLQLAVAGNFPLQLSAAGDLMLSAASTSVTATGVAENTVKPRLQSFLSDDISPNISNVSLSGPQGLLLQRFSLPGLQPKIDHAQIPADLLLAGTLASLPAP